MSIDPEDDILQDFLVEAGEILELLSEQLVELEQDPQNNDLLNAVFRGFHTIKGGAGFVNLSAMVEICHRAEDVFNVLRKGERAVDSGLMDAILRSLDVLTGMFESVRDGQQPQPARQELLAELEVYTRAQGTEPAPGAAQPDAPPAEAGPGDTAQDTTVKDRAEEDFERFLEDLPAQEEEAAGPAPGEEITEQEFEALLDQFHGEGKAPGKGASEAETEVATEPDTERSDQAPVQGAVPEAAPPRPNRARASQPEATVRVDTQRLDEIMNLVGELVLVRNRLYSLKNIHSDEALGKTISNLDMVTMGLQAAVMKTRMQPIRKVFGRFPRVVRDVARSLHKEVTLDLHGEDTDLDKNLVEALADPLVHLVRNAVDHGIEDPDERVRAGKPRVGKVVLAASPEGDHILLSIEDDGKGMDAELLRNKAIEKGLLEEGPAQRLSDEDAFKLIFMAGFSTKTEISDVSGRGVGMDVVKTRIEQLNGSIEILSEPGHGTRISIKVPLTLAILSTLMVVLEDQRFALPLSGVDEILDYDPDAVSTVEHQEMMLVRERALPLFYLRNWLVAGGSMGAVDGGHVVVVRAGNQRVGFVVDQLIGQEEVVIKPLSMYLQGLAGVAGATITGDGRIALVLDVPSLLKGYANAY